jgi:hypothetical protein
VACVAKDQVEMRGCFFSPDGEWVVGVAATGVISCHRVPDLALEDEQQTGLNVHCATLSSTTGQLCLGVDTGQVRFMRLEVLNDCPICVTATVKQEDRTSFFNRLLGRHHTQSVFRCLCPSCHESFELKELDGRTTACPDCHRRLRLNSFTIGA